MMREQTDVRSGDSHTMLPDPTEGPSDLSSGHAAPFPPEQLPVLSGRYLLVEGRDDVRRTVETSLSAVGADVVAENGSLEAVTRSLADASNGGFRAVLVGHTDGASRLEDAARKLRAGGYAGVLIALGVDGMAERDNDGEPGFDDHVGLPVRPIELVHKLATHAIRTSGSSLSSILFVEDHLDLASVQKLLLESRGHAVTVATDGRQAMEALRHFTPHAVLMDMGLPGGVSGADLLRQMKKQPALEACRFICTSGRQEVEVPWREIGFDGFLRKPSSLDDIIETLTTSR